MKLNIDGPYIIIVGAGALGSWLIDALSKMNRTRTFSYDVVLVDYDDVSERNLTSQNFIASDVGKLKTEVLKERYEHSNFTIHTINEKITLDNVTQLLNCNLDTDNEEYRFPMVVIDAVDNAATRIMLSIACPNICPVLHSAIANNQGQITWTFNTEDPDTRQLKTVTNFPFHPQEDILWKEKMNKVDKPNQTPPCYQFTQLLNIKLTVLFTQKALSIYLGFDADKIVDSYVVNVLKQESSFNEHIHEKTLMASFDINNNTITTTKIFKS